MNNKQMEWVAREHDMSGVDAETAQEAVKAAADVGCKKIENDVVEGFQKITDK